MLQSISWQTYFTTLFVVASIYYILIWFIYFRNRFKLQTEVPVFVQEAQERTAFKPSDHKEFLPKEHVANMAHAGASDNISPAAKLFAEELEALSSAYGENEEKATILLSIQHLIKKHSSSDFLADRDIINEIILATCKENCLLDLNEEDMKGLWKVEG